MGVRQTTALLGTFAVAGLAAYAAWVWTTYRRRNSKDYTNSRLVNSLTREESDGAVFESTQTKGSFVTESNCPETKPKQVDERSGVTHRKEKLHLLLGTREIVQEMDIFEGDGESEDCSLIESNTPGSLQVGTVKINANI